jgi:beta-xylosidase
LNLEVIPTHTYAIQASSDLMNWTVIATRNATNYWLNVTDSAAAISHRFYRAVQTAP